MSYLIVAMLYVCKYVGAVYFMSLYLSTFELLFGYTSRPVQYKFILSLI